MVKKVARYLASFIETNGNSATTNTHRMNAAKDDFYFLAGFWQALLPVDFKSIVFRAVVTGALMSGIEAEVLNKTKLDEI